MQGAVKQTRAFSRPDREGGQIIISAPSRADREGGQIIIHAYGL